jgi:hypothetical protein
MNKLKIFYVSIVIMLSGCTTAGQYQAECEKLYPVFSDMVSCLKEKLHADPRSQMAGDQPYVQRYLLEADKLSGMVQKNQISEIDARIRLSDLYMQLRNSQNAEAQEAVNSWQRQQVINNMNRPVNTNCHMYGGSVNCQTY